MLLFWSSCALSWFTPPPVVFSIVLPHSDLFQPCLVCQYAYILEVLCPSQPWEIFNFFILLFFLSWINSETTAYRILTRIQTWDISPMSQGIQISQPKARRVIDMLGGLFKAWWKFVVLVYSCQRQKDFNPALYKRYCMNSIKVDTFFLAQRGPRERGGWVS